MEIRRTLVAPCPVDRLFVWVDDLAKYPHWMRLVHTVEIDPGGASEIDPGGASQPAWTVELQARVGPLARSKRLRMVRTVHRVGAEAVFERAEIDGKSHSRWMLRALVEPVDQSRTQLTMELHYGGGLWTGAVLQRVLDDEVRRGSDALVDLVSREPMH